jgi:hypothetical protein
MTTNELCPNCGSAELLPLAFGYPSEAMKGEARAGRLLLGGCLCWGDQRDPCWACRSCGLRGGAVLPLATNQRFAERLLGP